MKREMQDVLIDNTMNTIMDHLRSSKYGYSIADLSKKMGLNRNTISKYLHILLTLGQVEVHVVGPSHMFTLSQRLPISTSYLKTLPESSYVADTEGKILWTNKYFLDKFTNSNDIVGKEISDLHLPILDLSSELPEYTSAVIGKSNIHPTWAYLNVDDTRHRLWISPVVFSDGTPAVLVLIETWGCF